MRNVYVNCKTTYLFFKVMWSKPLIALLLIPKEKKKLLLLASHVILFSPILVLLIQQVVWQKVQSSEHDILSMNMLFFEKLGLSLMLHQQHILTKDSYLL